MIMESKKNVRQEKKRLRDAMAQPEINKKSAAITAAVINSSTYKSADNILVYVSTGTEVDTSALIKAILADNKCVYVPKVYGRTMRFIRINSFAELAKGYMGIMEPIADGPVYEYEYARKSADSTTMIQRSRVQDDYAGLISDKSDVYNNTLCIMPGLAFDEEFNRVGYGGGFYDRFLSDKADIYKMAVCYECQMFDGIIESEENDVKADCIVTESRIRCES